MEMYECMNALLVFYLSLMNNDWLCLRLLLVHSTSMTSTEALTSAAHALELVWDDEVVAAVLGMSFSASEL